MPLTDRSPPPRWQSTPVYLNLPALHIRAAPVTARFGLPPAPDWDRPRHTRALPERLSFLEGTAGKEGHPAAPWPRIRAAVPASSSRPPFCPAATARRRFRPSEMPRDTAQMPVPA